MWDLLREQSYGGGPVMYCRGLLFAVLHARKALRELTMNPLDCACCHEAHGMWLLLSLCGEQSDAFEVQPRLAVQSALAGAAWWQPSLVPSLCLLSPQCSQRLEQ